MSFRFSLAALGALCAAACATFPSSDDAFRARLQALQARLPGEAIAVEAEARQILADAPSASVERGATHIIAAALADQGRCDELMPDAERAATEPDAAPFALRFAFIFNYECENYARSGALLTLIKDRLPDDISGLPGPVLGRVAPFSHDAATLSFIADGWRPQDSIAADMSEVRLALIRAHLDAHDQSAAAAAAHDLVDKGVSDFGAVIVLLSDRTFDSIVTADPEHFDFDRIAERFVANGFANYTAHPDRLSTLNVLAATLQTIDRSEEALALVDDALARPEDFSDRETQLNWIYQTRAELRADLGLEAEALEDLAQGAAQPENGRVNVSQRLNRAGMLLDGDQPQDALAEAEAVSPSDLSPYGRSVRRGLLVCSYAQLERTEEMRAVLAEAAAHGADSYRNLESAARCAEDFDLAAQAFISRLHDPSERRSAVLTLQSYAGDGPTDEWLKQDPVFSRADVRAAIDAEVKLGAYPIRRVYY
jgi:hypothetical protein